MYKVFLDEHAPNGHPYKKLSDDREKYKYICKAMGA